MTTTSGAVDPRDQATAAPPRQQPDLQMRSSEVAEALGVTRRQLQYWAKTGLVTPSVTTRGGHRRYTLADLVALKTATRLIDAGISVQRIRKSIQALQAALPRVERPLNELILVATGDVVVAIHEGAAFEAITGQEWVFEVAQFERELQSRTQGTSDEPIRQPRTVDPKRRFKRTA